MPRLPGRDPRLRLLSTTAPARRQVALVASIACAWLVACRLPEGPHLHATTADAVVDFLRRGGPNVSFDDSFTLSCTVVEGALCQVALPRLAQQSLSKELSRRVVDDVGAKQVEHSRRATVQVRCRRRHAEAVPPLRRRWECELDRWGTWQRLPVR